MEVKTESMLNYLGMLNTAAKTITVCDVGPVSARIYPGFPVDKNTSQEPQWTVIYVSVKPLII